MRKVLFLLLGLLLVIVASANLEALPEFAEHWPEPFQRTFLRVSVWKWILLGALATISVVAGLIGRIVTRRLTKWRDRFVPQAMSASTRASVSRAGGLVVGSMTALALLPSLRLQETISTINGKPAVSFGEHVELLLSGLNVLTWTMFCFSYWDATCDTLAAHSAGHQRAERLLVPMMRKFVRAVIATIGVLVAMAVLFGTQTLTGLVAGLGVTGLVVALAGKDSVENIFGSMTILFDMPFSLGDWVKIDKVEGSVEEINLRSTRIRTGEDTLITLPNANLIRASVENFGARRARRQKLNMRLSYASEPKAIEAFCESIREVINGFEEIDPTKTQVQLDDPSDTSIGVVMIWFLKTTSALDEARSRSKVLDAALGLRSTHGLTFVTMAPAP